MKATGIVRRIDDLGRVVIPKEIRRTMRIREGDPLEIFTDREGGVIFKKYSPLGELSSYAKDYCSALFTVSGFHCAICDTDSVIAYSGKGTKDTLESGISRQLQALILERKSFNATESDSALPITDSAHSPSIVAALPIIAAGDVAGAIAFTDTPSKTFTATEQKLLSAAALFLSKQLEN